MVYDITEAESYAGAKTWIDELQRQGSADIVIALAGNKLDLDSKRQVYAADAAAFAKENGCIFFETSAKTGENIVKIFEAIAERLPKHQQQQASDVIPIVAPEPAKKSCC